MAKGLDTFKKLMIRRPAKNFSPPKPSAENSAVGALATANPAFWVVVSEELAGCLTKFLFTPLPLRRGVLRCWVFDAISSLRRTPSSESFCSGLMGSEPSKPSRSSNLSSFIVRSLTNT